MIKRYKDFSVREKIDWHICMKGLFIAKIFSELGLYSIANKIIDFTDSIAVKYTGKEDE